MARNPNQECFLPSTKKTLLDTIEKFQLDLTNLVVLTEAASGDYTYTPMLAALANAKKVYAFTKDSKYGSSQEIAKHIHSLSTFLGCARLIEIVQGEISIVISECDIITNSGMLRPLDGNFINKMKPTAVIPLMWETWEWRQQELDLDSCIKHNILVLGTNERHPLLKLDRATGFLAYKMLFDCGIEAYNSRLLLLSSCPTGDFIAKVFLENDVSYDRLALCKEDLHRPWPFITKEICKERLAHYDAVIIAEHHLRKMLIGRDGFLTPDEIKTYNPYLQLIHICGTIDAALIQEVDLSLYPSHIAPWGYMSMMVSELGRKCVIDLNAAGLKVGEAMARARIQGMTMDQSIEFALKFSPAMAFPQEVMGVYA